MSCYCAKCGMAVVVRYQIAVKYPCKFCSTRSWVFRPEGLGFPMAPALAPMPKSALRGPVAGSARAEACKPKQAGVIAGLLRDARAADGARSQKLVPVPKRELKAQAKEGPGHEQMAAQPSVLFTASSAEQTAGTELLDVPVVPGDPTVWGATWPAVKIQISLGEA